MPITSGCVRDCSQHLLELVDDHLGEVLGVHLAHHDHRDVVQLLRVGH